MEELQVLYRRREEEVCEEKEERRKKIGGGRVGERYYTVDRRRGGIELKKGSRMEEGEYLDVQERRRQNRTG